MMRISAALSFTLISTVPLISVSAAPYEFNFTGRAADLENLEKRTFTNAQLTSYDISAGITACGGQFQSSALVVSLDSQQFGSGFPGPNCGKEIAITVNGKTVNAQVQDNCLVCPFGGLDLTEGLFEEWANLDVGILTGSWDFV